jgi:hypothetical protein
MLNDTFDVFVLSPLRAHDKFAQLREIELHAELHDESDLRPAISTTPGLHVVDTPPVSLADARNLAAERLRSLRPGDPAWAVPVAAPVVLDRRTDTREYDIPVGVDPAAYIASTRRLRDGESVVAAVLLDDAAAVTSTVTATYADAPAETRYFAVDTQTEYLPAWEKGHPSDSAARAALTTALPATAAIHERDLFFSGQPRTFEIVGITRRSDGSPLATLHYEPISARGSYLVTIEKRGALGARVGWLFFGVAAR